MGETIRILHVFNILDRGGAESMIMNYYREIDRDKYQFDFVVHSKKTGAYDAEVRKLGGNIYYVPKLRIYNIFSCIKAWINIFHKNSNILIVHGHMQSTAGLYLTLSRWYGRYPIAHAHSNDKNNEDSKVRHILRRILYRITRKAAKKFYACSLETGISAYGNNIVKQENFNVWHNAVNYDRFLYKNSKRLRIRKMLNIPVDAKVWGHVGRFTWAKNHEFLIKLFSQYNAEKNDTYLLLVGTGECLENIKELVKKAGLTNRVIFTGSVNNVEDYMSAMDVFVFPSRYEGLPTVNVEAQVNGLYCVVSDVITREVDISKRMIFVSLDDKMSWIEAIEKHMRKLINPNIVVQNYNIKKAVIWAENEYSLIRERLFLYEETNNNNHYL